MNDDAKKRLTRNAVLALVITPIFTAGAIAILLGFFRASGWTDHFTTASIFFGFLGLALTVYLVQFKPVDNWLDKIPPSLGGAVSILFFVVALIGALIAWHKYSGMGLDTEIIAGFANLVPGLSAALAVATRYDHDLTFPWSKKPATSDGR